MLFLPLYEWQKMRYTGFTFLETRDTYDLRKRTACRLGPAASQGDPLLRSAGCTECGLSAHRPRARHDHGSLRRHRRSFGRCYLQKSTAMQPAMHRFLPADDPEIIIYIAVDNAKGITQYGGTVAAPIAKNFLLSAIDILDIKERTYEIEGSGCYPIHCTRCKVSSSVH